MTIMIAEKSRSRNFNKFEHPLSKFVLNLFEKESILDVTIVSVGLGTTSDPKGLRAYRIVAADVLWILWKQGKIIGHDIRDTKKTEGGFGWFTHPDDKNKYYGEIVR